MDIILAIAALCNTPTGQDSFVKNIYERQLKCQQYYSECISRNRKNTIISEFQLCIKERNLEKE